MPLISVVLPTRDRRATLRRALDSLRRQTWAEVEILLVDNNRTEPPLAHQAEMQPYLADPRVVLIAGTTAGNAATARNLGLAAARGQWVTYLDDDDEYEPEKLQRQWERAEREQAPVVLCGCTIELPGRRRHYQCDREWWEDDAFLLEAWMGTSSWLHRWPCPVRFPEACAAGEDVVFGHRLAACFDRRKIPVVAAPLVRVHLQPGPRVNLQADAAWAAHRLVLQEHGARFSRPAQQLFALRADLARWKHGGEPWRRGVLLATGLIQRGGGREGRRILNALLFRLPGMRRWLVS